MMSAHVVTQLAGTLPSPAPDGYDPGDTGNWSDVGPWWGALVLALMTIPLVWRMWLMAIRNAFRHA